jgi:predicted nucleic acid-binding protein
MLEEYDEILTRRYGSVQARKVMRELTTAPNVKEVEVFFHWYLILDPDDNKFADCAFASNAAAIVTHDRHFNRLKYIEFPEIQVHTLDGLRTLLCGIEGGEDIFEW